MVREAFQTWFEPLVYPKNGQEMVTIWVFSSAPFKWPEQEKYPWGLLLGQLLCAMLLEVPFQRCLALVVFFSEHRLEKLGWQVTGEWFGGWNLAIFPFPCVEAEMLTSPDGPRRYVAWIWDFWWEILDLQLLCEVFLDVKKQLFICIDLLSILKWWREFQL